MKAQQAGRPSTQRKLTISNKFFPRTDRRFAVYPAIMLSGKWLQQAGFERGQIINVACRKNKLVITIEKN